MTRRTCLGLTLAAVLLALGSACEKTDAPAEPVWGKQACAHCGMLVGDRRYAAQAVLAGERKYFDDIGCMVLWTDEQKSRPERSWVRAGDAWVDAAQARYASGAKTPMDFGFEARPASAGSAGVGWDEARAQLLAKAPAKGKGQ